jgi:hypothetical protein
MRDLDRLLISMAHGETDGRTDEFPLPVAEDWDDLVSRSERMADLIDRHLDFESKLQGRELRPMTLCPEQKVSLVSDLTVV